MGRFDKAVFHHRPHVDEIVAYAAAALRGRHIWPGLDKAKFVFWNAGAKTPDGRPASEWRREGYLLIGVGGGHLDEHPSDTAERKQGECSATLTAKLVGIENDPAWRRLLAYVRANDTAGKGSRYDLAHLVRLLHIRYPHNPKKVMAWAQEAVMAEIAYGAAHPEETRDDFGLSYLAEIMIAKHLDKPRLALIWIREAITVALVHQDTLAKLPGLYKETAKVHTIAGPKGLPIKLACIESDDELIHTFAMSRQGGEADIVVIRRSNGHVAVMTNKRSGIRLRDLVHMIRLEEQKAAGQFLTTGWKDLGMEGTVPGAENWYYQESGEMLLNGSSSAPDVSSTRLSFGSICGLVILAMNTRTFEPTRMVKCGAGICTSTPNKPCEFYDWGLSRCRRVRYYERHPEQPVAKAEETGDTNGNK